MLLNRVYLTKYSLLVGYAAQHQATPSTSLRPQLRPLTKIWSLLAPKPQDGDIVFNRPFT